MAAERQRGEIAVFAALDTKGEEARYVRDLIASRGHEPLVIDTGVVGEPAFAPGVGAAEVARAGGADLIIIYNSGRYRMAGHGSLSGLLAFGDANQIVYEMGEREVLPVVKEVPVIAGVNGTDPLRQMPHFLKRLDELGFSGINNFPTVGLIDGRFRAELEATSLGFSREVEMIRTARAMGFFTIVYVFNPTESAMMAEAGADVIIAHMGLTVGGSIGLDREGGVAMRLEDAPAKMQQIGEAAWRINKDCLLVSHGGPIATPDDARYVQERTDAVGFIGASSMERLPVETAITETVRRFKEIPLTRRTGS